MQLNTSVALAIFFLGASIGALLVLLYYIGLRQRIGEELAEELRCALYPKYRNDGRRFMPVEASASAKRDTQPDALNSTYGSMPLQRVCGGAGSTKA